MIEFECQDSFNHSARAETPNSNRHDFLLAIIDIHGLSSNLYCRCSHEPKMRLEVHNVTAFYNHLTSHIVPGPNNISYFVPLLLLPIALCISPDVLSHKQLCVVFLPLIYACQLRSWQLMQGVDVISLMIAIWSFDLLVGYDPRTSFERIRLSSDRGKGSQSDGTAGTQNGRLAKTQNPSHSPFTSQGHKPQSEWSQMHRKLKDQHAGYRQERYPARHAPRLVWVLTLLPSLRLTHWRINMSSHDALQPCQTISRLAVLRTALSAIVVGYLLLDFTAVYVCTDAYFHDPGVSVDDPLSMSFLQILPPRLVRTSMLATQLYALIPCMLFLPIPAAIALSSLSILPNEWSPHTWGPFFGNFSSIADHGLRGLWGRWWHQLNRYPFSTPGRWLADCLGLPRKSAIRYTFLVISAFGFSGVIHLGLIPPKPLRTTVTPNEMRLHVAGFFWAQIPGIFIESATARLFERYFRNVRDWKVCKVVVLTWVAFWMSMTMPLLTPPFRELGYWQVWPVPVSLIRGMTVGTWWMWW